MGATENRHCMTLNRVKPLRQSRVELLMQSVCFRRANDKAPCNYACFTLSSAYIQRISIIDHTTSCSKM